MVTSITEWYTTDVKLYDTLILMNVKIMSVSRNVLITMAAIMCQLTYDQH